MLVAASAPSKPTAQNADVSLSWLEAAAALDFLREGHALLARSFAAPVIAIMCIQTKVPGTELFCAQQILCVYARRGAWHRTSRSRALAPAVQAAPLQPGQGEPAGARRRDRRADGGGCVLRERLQGREARRARQAALHRRSDGRAALARRHAAGAPVPAGRAHPPRHAVGRGGGCHGAMHARAAPAVLSRAARARLRVASSRSRVATISVRPRRVLRRATTQRIARQRRILNCSRSAPHANRLAAARRWCARTRPRSSPSA